MQRVILIGIRLGVFLVLLTPLVVTSSTLYPYVVGKAIYARSLIEIMFALWLVLALRNPLYRPRRSWILWLFGMYLFVSLVSAVVGVSFQRSFWGDYRRMGGVFDMAHWFALAVVLSSVFKTRQEWRQLLNANLGVGLVVVLLGLAQHYNIRLFDRVFWYLQPTQRVDVTFGNATYLGAYTMVQILVALGFAVQSFNVQPQPIGRPARWQGRKNPVERKRSFARIVAWRAFWVTSAGLNLWVLTLSGTRGAIAGLLSGLLFAGVVYLTWGHWKRMRLVAGALTAALLVTILAAAAMGSTAGFRQMAKSNVLLQRIVEGLSQPLGAYRGRLSIAETGLRAFVHAPVFGWGPENFAVAYDSYGDSDTFAIGGATVADQAHNKPTEELATKGILGFASYALLVGLAVWVLTIDVKRAREEQLFLLFLGAALFAYLVQNLFLFDTPGTVFQFILLLGWAAVREVSDRTENLSAENGPIGKNKPRPSQGAPGSRNGLPTNRSRFSSKKGAEGSSAQISALLNIATGCVLVLTVASLYYWNYRPYRAAQLFPLSSTTITQFFADAKRSFETFPPLANLGRQELLDALYAHWDAVPGNEESHMLEELELEGKAAIRAEPHNARLHLGLGLVYQRAAASNPNYLPVARIFLERASILAPALPTVIEALAQQQLLESSHNQQS